MKRIARPSLLLSALFSVGACINIGSESEVLPYFHVWYKFEHENAEHVLDISDPRTWKPFGPHDQTYSYFSVYESSSCYSLLLTHQLCDIRLYLDYYHDAPYFIEGERYSINTLHDVNYKHHDIRNADDVWVFFDLSPTANVAYTVNLEMDCTYYDDYYGSGDPVDTHLSVKIDVYESYAKKNVPIKRAE